MANQTAAVTRKTRNRGNVMYADYVVKTSEAIYAGVLVTLNATNRALGATPAAGERFVGIAAETKTGVAGGTVRVRCEWNIEALYNALTALTSAYLGKDVVASTDQDVTTNSAISAAKRIRIGEFVELEGGDAWVALRRHGDAVV